VPDRTKRKLLRVQIYHRVREPVRTYYRKYFDDKLFGLPFVVYFIEAETTWADMYRHAMRGIERYLRCNASSSSSSDDDDDDDDGGGDVEVDDGHDDDDDGDTATHANDTPHEECMLILSVFFFFVNPFLKQNNCFS
jgi:hypothetical protein